MLGGALLVSAVVIGAAPRLWQVANAHDQVPVSLPGFEPLSQRTIVYDSVDNVIAVFERENSQPITLAQVPPDVQRAILAVEDNEFPVHKGVNVRGLVRATLSNFSSNAPRQGGSTITQQVVKNEFLAGLERDSRYKMLQVHYALMLEKQLSKEQILERYLNTIYFGNNAYGLQAAAEVYFGKPVDQLDTIQGAFLAGLIRSPNGYDPITRPDRARARFRQVVDRLVAVGIIPAGEGHDLAEGWPIPEQLQALPSLETKPTYYSEALRLYLLQRSNILGDTEQDRANMLYRGGLAIHTTLDPRLQGLAEEARTKLPANKAGIDAAIVSLDSTSGAIRAMVGGAGFQPRVREVNMALVPRQTGSSIKMFVLAAALQAGAQPNDTINGTLPCELPNPGDPKDPFIIKQGVSKPVIPLDQTTWLSLNCGYSRLAQAVGLNRVVDTVYRLTSSPYLYRGQPKSDREPFEPYASLATGANEMSPLDMASGAQTIANNGVHHEPYYIESITRADGSTMYTHNDPGTQVLETEIAHLETSILRGVLTRGTAARSLAKFPFPAAGKTGTQVDNTNSWFVGYTPQLTTAVWVGDPDGYTKMTAANVPEFAADGVEAVQGGTYPARIWGAYTEPAIRDLPVQDFPAPPALKRPPVRIFLPGEECPYESVSGVLVDPNAPTTTVARTTTTSVDPGTGEPGTAGGDTTPTTVARVVIRPLPVQTTVPPEVLDPLAPFPTVPLKTSVIVCAEIPGNAQVLKPKASTP